MIVGPPPSALAGYWAERRRKVKPPLNKYTLRLLARQDASCPLCGDHLLTADQPPQSPNDWERWWQQVTRQAIAADYLVHHGRSGPPHNDQTRLVHASCRRGLRARRRRLSSSHLAKVTLRHRVNGAMKSPIRADSCGLEWTCNP